MHIFKVSIIAWVFGAIALHASGQPASQDQQNKALELLHQSLAQPAQNSAAPPAKPAESMSVAQPAPAAPPTMPSAGPASRPPSQDQQQAAIELLRKTLAETPMPSTNAPATK